MNEHVSQFDSDLSDAEWQALEPLLPQAQAIGRPRETNLRRVIDAILYMQATDCRWRHLPSVFPNSSTVRHYYDEWQRNGLWQQLEQIVANRVLGENGSSASRPGVTDEQEAASPFIKHEAGFDTKLDDRLLPPKTSDRSECDSRNDQLGFHHELPVVQDERPTGESAE